MCLHPIIWKKLIKVQKPKHYCVLDLLSLTMVLNHRGRLIYLYKSCENINMKFENDREVSSTNTTHTHTCN